MVRFVILLLNPLIVIQLLTVLRVIPLPHKILQEPYIFITIYYPHSRIKFVNRTIIFISENVIKASSHTM